jgi:Na+/H+ antiporter NhaD/arsenite permease-like protein
MFAPFQTLEQSRWIPISIFLVTYALIALRSGRGGYLDRTAAAFCGAVAMVLVGTVPLSQAYQVIDWNTIMFLLGVMILVAHFQVSGLFDWIAIHVATIARTRFQLFVLLVFTTGILSAFFVNDTICLVFTPIVLAVVERLNLPLVPYVVALATSANIGSSMSITGNPQNALVGVSAHLSFLEFLVHLAPVALVGLVLNIAVLAFFFRRELLGHFLPERIRAVPVSVNRVLLVKCALAAALTVVLWVFNFSFPLVAIAVGALILVIGRVPSEYIHRRVDWELLLFFGSLFVVIRGFEASGAADYLIRHFEPALHGSPVTQLFAVSGIMLVLSNLVSNVPAVLLFRSLVGSFPHAHFVWLALASTSTLAGNTTPFGSIANLIVLQQASKKTEVTFWEFTRAGLAVTLTTTVAAIFILALEFRYFPNF